MSEAFHFFLLWRSNYATTLLSKAMKQRKLMVFLGLWKELKEIQIFTVWFLTGKNI
jgi:hypothetical protein